MYTRKEHANMLQQMQFKAGQIEAAILTAIFFRNIFQFFISILVLFVLFVWSCASDSTACQSGSWIKFAVDHRLFNVFVMSVVNIWWNFLLIEIQKYQERSAPYFPMRKPNYFKCHVFNKMYAYLNQCKLFHSCFSSRSCNSWINN